MVSKSLERLAEAVRRSFAHVGPRQAKRMALQLLSLDEGRFQELTNSMKTARERVHRCPFCQNLTENEACNVCSDSTRDKSVIAVVENPQDVAVMEASKSFRGVYHVLHGGVDPRLVGSTSLTTGSRWTSAELMARLEMSKPAVREILLALDHDSDGELTSLYLSAEIRNKFSQIKLTRIGVGIPFGGEILYADPATLKHAIAARTVVDNKSQDKLN